MAIVATRRIKNIVSTVFGANTIKGILTVNLNVMKGKVEPTMDEGMTFPTGSEILGGSEFPVTGSLVYENEPEALMDMLVAGVEDLVITFKPDGADDNRICTISNVQFTRTSVSQNRNDFGKPQIEFVAFSTDGTSLPIAYSTAE